MWNPDLYLKYKDERTQPSYDLVSRINLPNPEKIVDIGCGPGNSTRVLRERWPRAQVAGLDSSAEMIQTAREAYPQETWIMSDAAQWETDEKFDIVFSSAALQWIPDHTVLIPKLFDRVKPGGVLAVQVPSNHRSPLHQAVLKVSKKKEWSQLMAGCETRLNYHEPGFYYELLAAISRQFTLWQTTYYHVLDNHQGLVDWYSSTGMRPYLERLATDSQKNAFREQVLEACRPFYPAQSNGKILFPFNRLFFLASHE